MAETSRSICFNTSSIWDIQRQGAQVHGKVAFGHFQGGNSTNSLNSLCQWSIICTAQKCFRNIQYLNIKYTHSFPSYFTTSSKKLPWWINSSSSKWPTTGVIYLGSECYCVFSLFLFLSSCIMNSHFDFAEEGYISHSFFFFLLFFISVAVYMEIKWNLLRYLKDSLSALSAASVQEKYFYRRRWICQR